MIDSGALLTDLKIQLKAVTADLRAQAEDDSVPWSRQLRDQFEQATARGRTGLTWPEWRDGEVDQAAVAWLVACTFVRFCEDNGLLEGARDGMGRPVALPWIAGPTGGANLLARAVENETEFYRRNPTGNSRDWLQESFRVLSGLPAGSLLVDREHNPVWFAPISASAAQALVEFWRRTDADGALVHDFSDPELDTRFLGDLYQDLSEFAKKRFALFQTPEFVEELILDLTLTPAVSEFGLEGLKLIDPTCGSGHFLLGAFVRLDELWRSSAPGMEARARVQKALDSIHGVDLNPFAVAIARFRLTVAALCASGENSLITAPAYDFHLAIGDSLLAVQGMTGILPLEEDEEPFTYSAEDVARYRGILEAGRYHVVVGNPPYPTVKDKALNAAYRLAYPASTKGKYGLSAPFMELFFRLARRSDEAGGAGFVGQITSNSFMKREFGTKVIENLLAGRDPFNPVDLSYVLDTSGAYIPGHGTPTVILVGRRRRASSDIVRAVLGKRGEPGEPADAATGRVWTEMVKHLREPGFEGTYVSVADLDREVLAHHPWSLSGGGAGDLKEALDAASVTRLGERASGLGIVSVTGEDAFYMLGTRGASQRMGVDRVIPLVEGEVVRDFSIGPPQLAIWPYSPGLDVLPLEEMNRSREWFTAFRSAINKRKRFGTPMVERGLAWWEWQELYREKLRTPLSIAFAFVATHNHFVLDRGGKVFKQSAPVIKLPAGASEDEHLDLLGVLNSSTACFWLKQVSYPKGGDPVGGQGARVSASGWDDRYEFTGTKLQEFPLPAQLPRERARALDSLAQELSVAAPAVSASAVIESLDDPIVGARIARDRWESLRRRMYFEQEELDWEVYRLYGLIDGDLTYSGWAVSELELGQRAFEITLARAVAEGREETAWFERHGSTPITELPSEWPSDYRELVQRRLDLIESDPFINLLERAEYKRRWQSDGWEPHLKSALENVILDRLEQPQLWRDSADVEARSVAQLADLVRHDTSLVRAASLLTGSQDVDIATVIGTLMAGEAVPYLAAHRFKPSGLEKHAEWEKVWELQRREDAGEEVTIPVPPKYTTADFLTTDIWKLRGKLDVPKERFISYPGVHRESDTTEVYGWAGWDHRDKAIALARLVGEIPGDSALPLIAGLVELEPWLRQWHSERDSSGTSPAETISTMIEDELFELGATRKDARAWRPQPATRARRRKK